ncbi:glutathione S-transferase family protein [Pseudohongiella sp. SYSU M77423]|uniref:glutathione S-transferase family protein n=1 Tax=unclassified Pseudohongiella TaxID=2629611 RepID=UPI001F3522C6|nr:MULTISPECIES: glutathione S-transferase family protein [unclassified Pseudohongiella]MDH7942890.1 glutathione S-transferase family protein [Pseudohongiella sp. SYSU M77423]MEC8860638.1 glutathione S-transferase family protein [Pseudomonadota bacterium]
MSTLTLYTNPWSRGRIARWMLEEIGQPYEAVVISYEKDIKSPDYLAINPMGKVPALKHGDMVITEVAAICTYLADQFPDKNLAPPVDSPLRGCYYRWLFFIAGPLEMATTATAFNWEITEKSASSIGSGRVIDVMSTLESALKKGPYLCGDQFTVADLLLASNLGWGMQFKTIEPRPVFSEYVERIQARPAHKRATELDDALAPLPG